MDISEIIKSNIPPEDLTRIIDSYRLLPHNELPPDEMFVYNIISRAYKEMCMDKTSIYHRTIHDKSILNEILWKRSVLDFLDKETYHYIENNLGFKWNADKEKFEGLSTEKYQEERGRVIHAFVKHAIDYFKSESKENIRTSLAEYLR